MIKTECEDLGVCCKYCQENVNIYKCNKCGGRFEDGDEIYCQHNSQIDSKHYHVLCKPD